MTSEERMVEVVDWVYGSGYAIAVVISWSRNPSVIWATVHGSLSWAYVLWFMAHTGRIG